MFKVGDKVRIIGAPLGIGMIEAKTGTVMSIGPNVRVELDNDRLYAALYFNPKNLELEGPRVVIPLPLPG